MTKTLNDMVRSFNQSVNIGCAYSAGNPHARSIVGRCLTHNKPRVEMLISLYKETHEVDNTIITTLAKAIGRDLYQARMLMPFGRSSDIEKHIRHALIMGVATTKRTHLSPVVPMGL